jgi:hypothetical protein
MLNKEDLNLVRELAARVAEIARLPIQEEKRTLWRKLNARTPARPMVMIDQVCWNEMEVKGELTLRCRDAECRRYEEILRRILFQWDHFRVDMVVEPFIQVPRAVEGTGFDLQSQELTIATDASRAVAVTKLLAGKAVKPLQESL